MDGFMNGYGNGNYPGGNMQGFDPMYYNSDALGGIAAWFAFCVGLFVLVTIVAMVFLTYRILTKAGYSGWLSLLVIVPFGFFAIILILAFDTWPTAATSFSPAGTPDPTKRVAKMTFAEQPTAPAPAPTPETVTPVPAPPAESDLPQEAPEPPAPVVEADLPQETPEPPAPTSEAPGAE